MAVDPEAQEELKTPEEVTAVVAEFDERPESERAIEELLKAGFRNEQVIFVARGAEHVEGKFVPGMLLVTVHGEERNDEAIRILRKMGALKIKTGKISATGEVIEESEQEAGAPS